MKDEVGLQKDDLLGKCKIEYMLGSGAMGVVYLALHVNLQIYVAIKVLPRSLTENNPDLAERFLREAQIMARIRDSHVVTVMDADRDEATGLCYIVLELVTGGNLGDRIRDNGAMDERSVLQIGAEVARALIVAGEHSVVHRDIKPDNIMLDHKGRAKLSDLGLAKISGAGTHTLTQGGAFMGTPAYMSPEQARDAKTIDGRADIYSLGATLYHALTGALPFKSETQVNMITDVLYTPTPDPRIMRPDLSEAATVIVLKMMAKKREDRYQNAEELLNEIETVLRNNNGSARGLLAEPFLYKSFDEDATSTATSKGIVLPSPAKVPLPASVITRGAGSSVLSPVAGGGQPVTVSMVPGRQPSRVCSVLFMDIVGYSTGLVHSQYSIKRAFTKFLLASLDQVVERKYEGNKAEFEEARIILDTGDGAAVCFLNDPEEALICGVNLQYMLFAQHTTDASYHEVRMGINFGSLKIVQDINGKDNPIGEGINVAQRIMSFSAPNQLLISNSFHDIIASLEENYSACCEYLGTRFDKHEREHMIYEYHDPEVEAQKVKFYGALQETAELEGGSATEYTAYQPSVPPSPSARRDTGRIPSPPPAATQVFPSNSYPPPPAYTQSISAGKPPTSIPPGWNPDTLASIEKQLARAVGPMARMLVKKAATQYSSLPALLQALATEIANPDERQAFLRNTSLPSTIAPSAGLLSQNKPSLGNITGSMSGSGATSQRIVIPSGTTSFTPQGPASRSFASAPPVQHSRPPSPPPQQQHQQPPPPQFSRVPQQPSFHQPPPPPVEPSRPPSSIIPATANFTQEDLEIITARLAKFVGPISKVLVKRASAKAGTIEELLDALLPEIQSEADQQKFISSLYQK